jgi:DNA-binding beta-propeller fold protein YncE
VVTTVGGTAGAFGAEGGTGSAAKFSNPYGVAVDGSGNLYVADFDNNSIRKGIPTAALQLTALGTCALRTNEVGLAITGVAGLTVAIESSRSFSSWRSVGSYILDGGSNYCVVPIAKLDLQYYRARVP